MYFISQKLVLEYRSKEERIIVPPFSTILLQRGVRCDYSFEQIEHPASHLPIFSQKDRSFSRWGKVLPPRLSIECVEPLLPAGVRRKRKKRLSHGSELPRPLRGRGSLVCWSDFCRVMDARRTMHGTAMHRDATRCCAVVCACFAAVRSPAQLLVLRIHEKRKREKERARTAGNYRSSAFTLKRPTVGDGMHLP